MQNYQQMLTQMLQNQSNQHCYQCHLRNPLWVSITNGIFLCLQCAAIHDRLGDKISKVRSLVIDSLLENDLLMLKAGGNERLHKFIAQYSIEKMQPNQRYNTIAMAYYRQLLANEVFKMKPSQKPSLVQGIKRHYQPSKGQQGKKGQKKGQKKQSKSVTESIKIAVDSGKLGVERAQDWAGKGYKMGMEGAKTVWSKVSAFWK